LAEHIETFFAQRMMFVLEDRTRPIKKDFLTFEPQHVMLMPVLVNVSFVPIEADTVIKRIPHHLATTT
jgi:hypothetical protein